MPESESNDFLHVLRSRRGPDADQAVQARIDADLAEAEEQRRLRLEEEAKQAAEEQRRQARQSAGRKSGAVSAENVVFDDDDDDSKRNRALIVGAIAMSWVVISGATGVAEAGSTYTRTKNTNAAIEAGGGQFVRTFLLFNAIDYAKERIAEMREGQDIPEYTFSSPDTVEPTASPTPTETPTSSPTATNTPTAENSTDAAIPPAIVEARTPEQCIDDMPDRYKLAQNSIFPIDAETGSYLLNPDLSFEDTAKLIKDNGIGNVFAVGDPTKDPEKNLLKFRDKDLFPDGVIVHSDLTDGVGGKIPSPKEVSSTLSFEETTALLEPYFQKAKANGIDAVHLPSLSVNPTDPNLLKSPEDALEAEYFFEGAPGQVSALTNLYADAAVDAGLRPIVTEFPGVGSGPGDPDVSATPVVISDKKSLEAYDLQPWGQLVDGIDSATVSTAVVAQTKLDDPSTSWTNLEAAAFSNVMYDELRKKYGMKNIYSEDLGSGSVRDENGRYIILPDSFVKVWQNGGIPMFKQDAPNSIDGKVLDFERRADTIFDKGEAAVKDGVISEEALNLLMKNYLETTGQLDNACEIEERISDDD